MLMDPEWIYYRRDSKRYRDGAQQYVDRIHASLGHPPTMKCPCRVCKNMQWHEPKKVFGHICMNELHPLHVSKILNFDQSTSVEQHNTEVTETYHLLKDALIEDKVVETIDEIIKAGYKNIVEEAERPLYSECPSSQIASIVSLFKYRARHNLSDNALDELFRVVNRFLPEGNILPDSLHSAREILKAFDLGYEKIHACVNDCCLFRKELGNLETCPKCGSSRWKVDKHTKKVRKGIPAKVLRYFPIIPRFRRMFKSAERVEELVWHCTHKSQDGKMRHPVDSPAWKHIDNMWPEFASEPRNLRIGLATDGFNPFGDFNSRHSCWPVMLTIYNFSPSFCMSKENLMLTMLIPGPKQPGKDIDVYLQPLVEDLSELWDNGVSVYDASKDSTFNMKAILMWTINDFPAYGNLSGYSTKGKKACPTCGVQTCSKWLENGKKHVYMSHRRWLRDDHPFRFKAAWFDGTEEHRTKPIYLTGSQILQVVKGIENDWGKKRKGREDGNRKRPRRSVIDHSNESDDDGDNPFKLTKRWKKRSLFWDLLPYWEHLLVRHNLDVMHVEKNVCESLLGTLLNMKGRTKDNLNSRKDLKKMGIRKKLHLKNDDPSTFKHTTPAYVLSKKERQTFCERIASLRMPDGYCSNISSKVSLEDCKILGLKSHDCHVLMQQVLPVALRGLLPNGPRIAILRLCATFNQLCQRVLDENDLARLQEEVAETLCMLERFFPPSFFDVMVHLTIHLVEEARICGPVHLRWMYPPERFMKTLKEYVKNRSNPEGCIAEKYLVEELTGFCSSYFKQAADVGVQHKRNEDLEDDDMLEGRGFGKKRTFMSPNMLQIAHRYVLLNLIELEPWRKLHKEELKLSNTRLGLARNEHILDKKHVDSFAAWLSEKVTTSVSSGMSSNARWIGCGPKEEVINCSGFIINGSRFHTKETEKSSQNSGVFVEGDTYCRSSAKDTALRLDTVNYYGVIREIILLDYHAFKVPLFQCDWANIGNGVKMEDGFTLVNLSQGRHQFERDPFIFASQAKQVFYSKESKNSNWLVVLQAPPRGFYEDENFNENEYMPCALFDVSQLGNVDGEDCMRCTNEEVDDYDSEHYIVEKCYKKQIFQRLARRWSDHKSRTVTKFKQAARLKGFDIAASNSLPRNVHSLAAWKKFLKSQMTAQALEKSKKFRNLRSKRKLLHKTSRKSMAQVEYEMKEQSSDPDSIGRSDVWLEAYGSNDKDDVEDAEIVQQVKKLKLREASSSVTDDAVAKVLGPERRGRVRGLGFGALPSKIDGQAHASRKYSKLEQEVHELKLSVQRILSKFEKEDENNGNDNIPSSSCEHSINKNKNAPVRSANNVSVCGKKRKEPGSKDVGNHREASQVPSIKKLQLLSWLDAEKKIVASADLHSKDPKEMVHCVPIGHGMWKVWVRKVYHDIPLIRPTSEFNMLSEAMGSTVAWPVNFIEEL